MKQSPCHFCRNLGRWDSIGSTLACPDCLETLAASDEDGVCVVEAASHRPCVLCGNRRTVRWQTYPRSEAWDVVLAVDLCGRHVRALAARSLCRHAFLALRQWLGKHGLGSNDVFLLHDAFYDSKGTALQPVKA